MDQQLLDLVAVTPRYLEEMQAQRERIEELGRRVAAGESVTLLCSSACIDPSHCHRTWLKQLIEAAVERVNRSTAAR
jgi:uncharacterized protein YeaO (DUF488 family)